MESVRRRREAVRLDIDDVDRPRNRILIFDIASAQGKPVTSPPPTKAVLPAWLAARGPEPSSLFVSFDRAGKGHRLTGAVVSHIVGRLGATADRLDCGILRLMADARSVVAAIDTEATEVLAPASDNRVLIIDHNSTLQIVVSLADRQIA